MGFIWDQVGDAEIGSFGPVLGLDGLVSWAQKKGLEGPIKIKIK